MLEKIDLNKKMSKQEYSESLPKIEAELGRLQRECKDLDIPVMIVFEGFGASGKGLQIGKLIHSMDPRGFEVHTIKNETEEERMHPFFFRLIFNRMHLKSPRIHTVDQLSYLKSFPGCSESFKYDHDRNI